MRRIVSFIAAAVVSAVATAHTISVGYALHGTGTDSGLSAAGKNECSAALRIDPALVAQYTGNGIRSVRVSLPNTKVYVDSVVVWVRKQLDGENLATGKITRFKDDGYGDISKGWNAVDLGSSVAIEANTPLYVGYTYYQRTKVCATRLASTSVGESYVKLGAAAEWTAVPDNGTLAIEAGIDGDAMPSWDVWLMSARGLVLADGTRQIEARVYNRGQNRMDRMHVNVAGSGYSSALDVETGVEPDALDTITFTIPAAGDIVPGNSLSVNIDKIGGNDDVFPENNSASCVFNYLRIVLLEEFTTENCPNCPAAAGYINEILADKSMSRHMAVVCHHSGYHTDAFTTQTDLDYEWFYGTGGAFAPGVMFNRNAFGASSTVFSAVYGKDYIAAFINAIASGESSLIIRAEANYSADGTKLHVNVYGNKIAEFGNTDQRITLFLTEDNVLANSQAGSGTDTYYHQHVMRGINSTWGVPVEWNGDGFTYEYTFDIDPAWKKADIKAVASVGDYDSSDYTNCMVENTAVAVPDATNGIHNAESETAAPKVAACYSAGGALLQSPCRGISVVKYSDGTCRKVVR